MSYQIITPINTPIHALDMHGMPSGEFIPFSVRGPQFVELKDGTLIYFFEAKYHSQLDEEPSCKVLLRSHDHGQTWGEARLLTCDSFPFPIGGAPVYDEVHDTLLFFGRTRHWKPEYEQDQLLTEQDQVEGLVDERFWVTKSTDGGLTWSDYREIFLDAPDTWRVQHCPTPSSGLQLKHQRDAAANGRLVVPANHILKHADGSNEFGCHLLISEDYGETWRMGAVQDYKNGNECLAVELRDGTLLLNARTHGSDPANIRLQSISHDGGDTFTENGPVASLYDPCCNAGFASAVVDGKEYIFFTAPAGELDPPWEFLGYVTRWGRREMMTLHMSSDGGRTYRPLLQLSPRGEFAAYSFLHATADGKLLCAWESGPQIGLYRDIKFEIFDLAELVRL